MEIKLHIALWFAFILILLSGCNRQGHSPDNATDITTGTPVISIQEPIAIVSLEDRVLTFDCVDRNHCLPNISLDRKLSPDSSYRQGPVFYWSSSSVYAILYEAIIPWQKIILHFNPLTGQVKSIELPKELQNLIIRLAEDRLILVNDNSDNVFIIHHDLSIVNVKVGHPINKLIETGSQNVIALNTNPVENGSDSFVEVSEIDIVMAKFTQKRLKLPLLEPIHDQSTPEVGKNYLINIEGISTNLKYLYCLFYRGDTPHIPRLGAFNFETSREIASTQERELIKMTSGYAEYHDRLFTPGSPVYEEYSIGPTLIDMSAVKSLIDYESDPELRSGKFYVVPHGESFLLGTANQILIMSPTGKILKKYPLPEKWIDRRYAIMYYIK